MKNPMKITDKDGVDISINLKYPDIISCTLSVIQISLSLIEIFKECLMREGTKIHAEYLQDWLEGKLLQF